MTRRNIARLIPFFCAVLAVAALSATSHRIAAQSAHQPDLAAIDLAWSDPGLDPDSPGTPIVFVPKRWRNCSASAPMP